MILKDCPICKDGRAEVTSLPGLAYVRCDQCGAHGPAFYKGHCGCVSPELEAARSWNMTTGQRLEAKMRSLGINKRQLSAMSRVSYRTVQRVCSGDDVGGVDTWRRLAFALGCGLDELLGIEK